MDPDGDDVDDIGEKVVVAHRSIFINLIRKVASFGHPK